MSRSGWAFGGRTRDSPGSLIMGFNPAEIGLDGQPLGDIVVASSPSLFLLNSIVF